MENLITEYRGVLITFILLIWIGSIVIGTMRIFKKEPEKKIEYRKNEIII